MLDLKDSEIIKFYKNLEDLIGKDLSYKIKNGGGKSVGDKQ